MGGLAGGKACCTLSTPSSGGWSGSADPPSSLSVVTELTQQTHPADRQQLMMQAANQGHPQMTGH